ncbi:MAG: DUF3108 domain-containing protein [Mariprofundales bacterium]
MMTIRYVLFIIITMVFMILFSSTASYASECKMAVGEVLTFDVGWEFVNAGSATMQVLANSNNGWRVNTLAKTNGFFDMFKKVRDQIISEGICIEGQKQSTLFDVKQLEVKYKADKKTHFLWHENKVSYTHNGKTEMFAVPAGYLNVMDAFFHTRSLALKKGDILRLPVFDSRKLYEVEVHVIGREVLRDPVTNKYIPCLIIEPKLKTEGIFSSVGTMKIWLTDDARRLPFKLTAKIKIGRIIGRLTNYKSAGNYFTATAIPRLQ